MSTVLEFPGVDDRWPVHYASQVTGDGWKCGEVGDRTPTSTCTRSDTLQPGRSYPPIKVSMEKGDFFDWDFDMGAHTSAASARDARCADVSINVNLQETPAEKRASAATPPLLPGGPDVHATFKEVAAHKNPEPYGWDPAYAVQTILTDRPTAGPVSRPITTELTFFRGQPNYYLGDVYGDGWKCDRYGVRHGGNQLLCTRTDPAEAPLQPGQAYPPITADIKYGSDFDTLKLEVKTTTTGDCATQCFTDQLHIP